MRSVPPSAVDAYWDMDGNRVDEVATFDGPGGFNSTYPNHWEPRLVAGAPLTNDVYKCQLKAVNTSDYRVAFSAEQEERRGRGRQHEEDDQHQAGARPAFGDVPGLRAVAQGVVSHPPPRG